MHDLTDLVNKGILSVGRVSLPSHFIPTMG